VRTRIAAFLALALSLSSTALLAQPPRDVPIVKEVGPDDVRRVGDWLRKMQGGKGLDGFDPKMLEQFNRLKKQNPDASDEQIARQLADQFPGLNDPEQLAKWKDIFDKYGQQPSIPPGKNPDPLPRKNPVGRPPFERPPQNQPPQFRPDGARVPEPLKGRKMDQFDRTNSGMDRGTNRGSTTPEDAARKQRQFGTAAKAWEENFGPLNDTPAVKQLLFELVTGQDGSGRNKDGFGDLFEQGAPDAKSLDTILDSDVDSSGFKLPEIGLGKLDFGGSGASTPPSPSSSGPSFSGFNGGEGSWLPVILFVAVLGGALLLWWIYPKLIGGDSGPRPIPGLGPWPVDPRTINDRAALVKAFEYLSVLLCGGGARTWNHLTIAEEFRRQMPQAEAIAEPLAWLYAAARYTPANEPLPPGSLELARVYLCDLAGVKPE